MATGTIQTQGQPAAIDWQKYALWAAYFVAALLFLIWLRDAVSDKSGARLLNTTITGILVGGIYALAAVGIVIINKASGVFNFAHGYMMYCGSLVFFSFYTVAEISLPGALLIAGITSLLAITMNSWRDALNPRDLGMAVAATLALTLLMTLRGSNLQLLRSIVGALTTSVLIGLVIERLAIRPLISQPLFTIVLMTLAVDRVLAGLSQLFWGSIDRPLTIFAGLGNLGIPNAISIDTGNTFLDGTIRARSDFIVAFVLALIAFTVFVLFFRYTNVGLAMRATAENQQLAQSVGLRVRFVLGVAWGIAAILAMTAGVLQGGAANISKGMPGVALRAFPAVLLGGLDSIGGALIGGLVIGVVQEWANLIFPGTEAGTELAPYVVLMVVLIIRPDGLFGQKRIERI